VEQKEVKEEEGYKCKIINNMWEVLGRGWALLILKNLNTREAIRFNELKRLCLILAVPYCLIAYWSWSVKGSFQRRSIQKYHPEYNTV
jgi:hypothetical protein